MRFSEKILLTVTIAIVFFSGLMRPYYNWDIVGYVAAAYYKDGAREAILSQNVYDDIAKEVSSEKFSELIRDQDGGSYRGTVFKDPKSLVQQIPFYSIRVIYVELLRKLKALGVEYSRGTYFISAIFSAFSVLLVGILSKKLGVSMMWLPVVVVLSGYLSLARFSTPDALACFYSLFCLLVSSINRRWGCFVAIFLPLFRTDFVLLSLLINAVNYFRGHRVHALSSAVLSILIYVLINKLEENYGYWVIFNFTLAGPNPYPRDVDAPMQYSLYASSALTAAHEMIFSKHGFIYVTVLILFLSKKIRNKISDLEIDFLIICSGFIFLHLVIFPIYMDRFFVFAVTILSLVGVSLFLRVRH